MLGYCLMIRWGLLFFFLVSVSSLAAESVNSIVAIVNDDTITRLEVEREFSILRDRDDSISVEKARRDALDNLINRRLQLQLADRYRIVISDKILDNRLSELQQEFNLPDRQALERFAESNFRLSYSQFRQRVLEDMRIRSVFYREVFSKTQVYEDEIEQFLKQETDIGTRQQYRLQHILIAIDESSDADKRRALMMTIRARAINGEDFATLAKSYSDGERATKGGDLGYKTEEELPLLFVKEAQQMAVGEISPMIESQRGFHLLKLAQARGGSLREKVDNVRLKHIFLPLTEDELAVQVYNELQQGLDFAEAVTVHSVDQVSISKEGDLGWFSDEELPTYFVDAIDELAVGEISKPAKSPFGWHLLLVSDRRTNQLDIQRLRHQATNVLRERRALSQRGVWLRRLRGSAYVKILQVEYR